MKNFSPCFLSLLLVFTALGGVTQISDTTINIQLVRIGLGFSVPAGDMADRYGVNGGVGGSYMFKNSNNWTFGVEYEYLFGGEVKDTESVFENITASNGYIIDATGGMALMDSYERGFAITGTVGRVFQKYGRNPNSGLLLNVGAGYLTHKIHTEVYMNLAPQIYGDYMNGYDRLSGGPVYSLFLGYQNIDPQNIFNFYAGMEFKHAMTKPLRDYQFDLMGPESQDLRHDIFFSVKVGWMLPLYRRSTSSYYYY